MRGKRPCSAGYAGTICRMLNRKGWLWPSGKSSHVCSSETGSADRASMYSISMQTARSGVSSPTGHLDLARTLSARLGGLLVNVP